MSIDYDALVTEAGDYTPKYMATMELFRAVHPHLSHPPPPPVKPHLLNLSVSLTHELTWPQIISHLVRIALWSLIQIYMFVFSVDIYIQLSSDSLNHSKRTVTAAEPPPLHPPSQQAAWGTFKSKSNHKWKLLHEHALHDTICKYSRPWVG